MTAQNYFLIENNVVTNIEVWDTPLPTDITLIPQATTPAKIWTANFTTTPYSWEINTVIGAGDIGFTWDGTVLTTNQSQPSTPPEVAKPATNQATTTGTTTIA